MTPPMPASFPSDVVAQVRKLLGLRGDESLAELATMSLDALQQQGRRALLECARRLGLNELGDLPTDALARQFKLALERLRGAQEPTASARAADPARKFDLGQPAEREAPLEHIPWSYGQDRVTAIVIDPERLYVYWEVTDEAIARARAGLGPAGSGAWPSLRLYDVTGRLFDGTNAHMHFDQKVERTDRQWFFTIGKPTSVFVVELGMQSMEGYFVKIARSARAEFPRVEPVAAGPVEWLTVRTAAGALDEPPTVASPVAPAAGGRFASPGAAVTPEERWERIVREERMNGHRHVEWEGPVVASTWEAGPFHYPVEAPAYVEERYQRPVTVRVQDGRTHVVHSAWEVVIRGIGARAERRVVAVWQMEYRTAASGDPAVDAAGAPLGASEQRIGASERRIGGASELHFLGASERRLRGASELILGGASEWRHGGASDRFFPGVSRIE